MTCYCFNPKCPLNLHTAPIGADWAEVQTPEYGPIFMSHQIVAGHQYCDHCAREKRFGVERERVEFGQYGQAILFEKLEKAK